VSDEEFNRLIDELTEGLPITLGMTRLALTVRALVEMGGQPAVDALRVLVSLHRQGRGDYSEEPPAALVEELDRP